ncbi:MAG: LytR/AlgR family response regulator transcription factor [Flavobacterium sp.]
MLYPKKVKQLKNFTFVIIDDNPKNRLKTKATAESFQNLTFLAMADNYEDGIDIVLEYYPDVIFLEIDPQEEESKLSLAFINELYRYLSVIPKIIVTTTNDALCLQSYKYGVFDYLINPIATKELRKSIFRLDKESSISSSATISSKVIAPSIIVSDVPQVESPVIESEITPIELVTVEVQEEVTATNESDISSEEINDVEEAELIDNKSNISEEVASKPKNNNPTFEIKGGKDKPLIICVKSYGDYRYIDAKDICYLQADNNSTDIHLNTGEMITAFKTLKHFEGVLSYPFVRIHNSYILNIDYVSRIHTGNAVCHIKNTTTKLPFSKSYKENIDTIITTIASGNYLEI